MNIPERINQLAKERGISSINELGRIVKIPQSTLATIMIGKTSPRIDTLQQICDGLDITLAEFFMDKQTKQQISNDLFPKLLQIIQAMDLPEEIKVAALQNFNSLTDSQKNEILPQLVKSVYVAEDHVQYEVDGSTKETIDKYKSLPDKHRKALEVIIDSLYKSH